jgi:hypothetical protein
MSGEVKRLFTVLEKALKLSKAEASVESSPPPARA